MFTKICSHELWSSAHETINGNCWEVKLSKLFKHNSHLSGTVIIHYWWMMLKRNAYKFNMCSGIFKQCACCLPSAIELCIVWMKIFHWKYYLVAEWTTEQWKFSTTNKTRHEMSYSRKISRQKILRLSHNDIFCILNFQESTRPSHYHCIIYYYT